MVKRRPPTCIKYWCKAMIVTEYEYTKGRFMKPVLKLLIASLVLLTHGFAQNLKKLSSRMTLPSCSPETKSLQVAQPNNQHL